MACAMAFGSQKEFEHWLGLYIRALTRSGQANSLRIVVDMLKADDDRLLNNGSDVACWWISTADTIMGLDRTTLLKQVVIPELSKNRSLQRLTNEIALEIGSL